MTTQEYLEKAKWELASTEENDLHAYWSVVCDSLEWQLERTHMTYKQA